MASPKFDWVSLWATLWRMIPDPQTEDRLIVALDDFINPKTGKKVFACHHFFDHAAKSNQDSYPWSQNVVTIGLLKVIKGRWACLPLAFRFYRLEKDIVANPEQWKGKPIPFETKFSQAAAMLCQLADVFNNATILLVTDSWFGCNGLMKLMSKAIGSRFELLSRLRSNTGLWAMPEKKTRKGPGRNKKYGDKLGSSAELAKQYRNDAYELQVEIYGQSRKVIAYDQIVMLKSIRCQVRVVWIFRKKQWVALFSTNLSLSVKQIIEYYAARWKIEAAFKEIKQEIGSSKAQNRDPVAVTNHLHFCMMAPTLIWCYADRLKTTPSRYHQVKGRSHFAFSDVRKMITKAALHENFRSLCPRPHKAIHNSFVSVLMRMVA